MYYEVRQELMSRMAVLELKMLQPERGQTTLESLRNDIAVLADVVWQIVSDIEPPEA